MNVEGNIYITSVANGPKVINSGDCSCLLYAELEGGGVQPDNPLGRRPVRTILQVTVAMESVSDEVSKRSTRGRPYVPEQARCSRS